LKLGENQNSTPLRECQIDAFKTQREIALTSHLSPNAKVNFFASHSWTHSRRRDGLHAVLQPWVRGIEFEDFSISRAHPLNTDADPELARELRNIIVHMDALLIMAGMYANNSPWMQFEINMAFAFNVPIIPILALGQQRVPRLPMRLATCQPVRWRGDSIREALLDCISSERRQTIESRVAYRVAVAKDAERQRRAAEAMRSVQALSESLGFTTPKLPPPRWTPQSEYVSHEPTLTSNYLADLLRRR
jgi:hypothetical protein